MSLTIFCLSFNKQANYWDMGVESRTFSSSGGTWFPLTMKLSNLRTLILMREECQGSLQMLRSHSLPLQGGYFELNCCLWCLLENYSKGDILLIFSTTPTPPKKNKNFWSPSGTPVLFMCSESSEMTGVGARPNQILWNQDANGFSSWLFLLLIFFLILTESEFDWKGKWLLGKQFAYCYRIICTLFNWKENVEIYVKNWRPEYWMDDVP